MFQIHPIAEQICNNIPLIITIGDGDIMVHRVVKKQATSCQLLHSNFLAFLILFETLRNTVINLFVFRFFPLFLFFRLFSPISF